MHMTIFSNEVISTSFNPFSDSYLHIIHGLVMTVLCLCLVIKSIWSYSLAQISNIVVIVWKIYRDCIEMFRSISYPGLSNISGIRSSNFNEFILSVRIHSV